MTTRRVAVLVGAGSLRVAVAGDSSPPVVELPAPPGPVDLPDLVERIAGPGPVQIVLVHPVGWAPERIAAWTRGAAVPVPVAAAGPERRLVLDVGVSGAEATLVERGRVLACRRSRVGGARLDEAVAGLTGTSPARARRVREALSLLPEAGGIDAEQLRATVSPLLDELAAMVRTVGAPVLLIGGVARSPLVAEALDEAGVADVVVAPRPETAAVLGALALPTGPVGPLASVHPLEPAEPADFLPPPQPSSRRLLRRVLGAVAAAAVAAGLLAAGTALGGPAVAVPAGTLVQYGYRFAVPAGWEHTGGLPERRRSLLTPVAAPESSDLIAVERTPLGYDAAAEPERARAELRAVFDAAVAAGDPLSDYGAAAVAGRGVTTYRQREVGAVVEWFVVLDGDAQLSVGCRHTPAGKAAVRAACAVVVASVRRD